MIALALSLTLLAAAPGDGGPPSPPPDARAVVVVAEGETLEAVALRSLGDEKAASELRAINRLAEDATLVAGARITLPGKDRGLAASALSAAAKAVSQASDEAKKAQATARLAEAERLFAEARYADSAVAADEAWALVSGESKLTRFRVEVAKDGETEVASASGAPIRVEAQGVVRPVYSGESVKVKKGEAPPLPVALVAPSLIRPARGSVIRGKRAEGALPPVTLSWSAVSGAESYELELRPAKGGEPMTVTVARTSTTLRALAPGRYVWSVRALRGRDRSEAAAAREFELVEEALKLEVKGSSWK